MGLWLLEQGIEHRRVFADTGWEHPATIEYIMGPLQDKLGPIDVVRSPLGGFAAWCLDKGMFPGRTPGHRWCTSVLKIEPLKGYMAQFDGPIVNAVGVRREESVDRAKLPEWDKPHGRIKFADDTEVWRPLIHWTKQQVIDIHRRHGLAPNPLYLKGAERVGCWPCVCSGKKALRLVADLDPRRIDEIRQLEADVQELARARYEARGETFESLGYTSSCSREASAAVRAAGSPFCSASGRTSRAATTKEHQLVNRRGGEVVAHSPRRPAVRLVLRGDTELRRVGTLRGIGGGMARKKRGPHLRGEVVIADLTTLQPNSWNGNQMDELERESIKAGFRKEGWLVSQALTVWRTDETGEEKNIIIDGEQRWTCALDAGLLQGPVVYLDGITEAEARKLTVQLYKRRGAWTDEGLAAALQPIDLNIPTDSLELGFEPEQLAHLMDIDLTADDDDDGGRERERDGDGGGSDAVFAIVVECHGEADQNEKLEEMLGRGWKCRALI